jgi:hypothetical protein
VAVNVDGDASFSSCIFANNTVIDTSQDYVAVLEADAFAQVRLNSSAFVTNDAPYDLGVFNSTASIFSDEVLQVFNEATKTTASTLPYADANEEAFIDSAQYFLALQTVCFGVQTLHACVRIYVVQMAIVRFLSASCRALLRFMTCCVVRFIIKRCACTAACGDLNDLDCRHRLVQISTCELET